MKHTNTAEIEDRPILAATAQDPDDEPYFPSNKRIFINLDNTGWFKPGFQRWGIYYARTSVTLLVEGETRCPLGCPGVATFILALPELLV